MSDAFLRSTLLGNSAVMYRLRALIARVAPTTLPILIEGPTGVGKELVARAVHAVSGRSGSFVAFNVCAIADTMFEDALFGHVRGAFTGAISDTHGYLAQADNGTLFLDEIAGLSLAGQAKLLRALELREFRPVGARHDEKSDFRLLAATNESLLELHSRQKFRDDLLHRFGKVVLRVPPLAERREDIELLAAHFLAEFQPADPRRQITSQARIALEEHSWPGNVRELRAVMETAAVLTGDRAIERDDLQPLLAMESAKPPRSMLSRDLQRTIETLTEVDGDAAAAAALLGVNKTTIYRRLRRAQLTPDALRRADRESSDSIAPRTDIPATRLP